jgi:hypothetical protein
VPAARCASAGDGKSRFASGRHRVVSEEIDQVFVVFVRVEASKVGDVVCCAVG